MTCLQIYLVFKYAATNLAPGSAQGKEFIHECMCLGIPTRTWPRVGPQKNSISFTRFPRCFLCDCFSDFLCGWKGKGWWLHNRIPAKGHVTNKEFVREKNEVWSYCKRLYLEYQRWPPKSDGFAKCRCVYTISYGFGVFLYSPVRFTRCICFSWSPGGDSRMLGCIAKKAGFFMGSATLNSIQNIQHP